MNETKTKKPITKRWWFWAIVVIFAIGIIGSLFDSGSDDNTATTTEKIENTETLAVESETPEETKEPEFIFDISALTDSDLGQIDTGNLNLNTGELLYVNYGGNGVVIIKAKIQSQWSNELTISQNYYNVCDLIKNHGFDSCEEIQYWAIADTTTGDETKVISFTVDKETIQKVKNGTIVENKLGNYVSDLYILPSLQN